MKNGINTDDSSSATPLHTTDNDVLHIWRRTAHQLRVQTRRPSQLTLSQAPDTCDPVYLARGTCRYFLCDNLIQCRYLLATDWCSYGNPCRPTESRRQFKWSIHVRTKVWICACLHHAIELAKCKSRIYITYIYIITYIYRQSLVCIRRYLRRRLE